MKDFIKMIMAPNFVNSPTIILIKEEKDVYIYPIEGWYWFESKQDAISTLGITETIVLSTDSVMLEMRGDINNIFDIMNERKLL